MSNDSRSKDLGVQLQDLQKELYGLVDDALIKIVRSCAGLTLDVVKNVVEAVFYPLSRLASELEAAAASAKATDTPAPKEIAEERTMASADQAAPVVNESASKRRGRKAVWVNSSDKSLRMAHARRVQANEPIEPDLAAALAERFSSYDPVTQRFSGATRGRKAVWSKSSDAALRQAHAKRVRANAPIEPDLEAALAERFQNYDLVTHRFTGATRKEKSVSESAPKRPGRKAVWANSSDASLRQAHAKRVRANAPIEPDLEAALAERFSSYDPVTHRFTRATRSQKTEKAIAAPVSVPVVENTVAAETLLSSPQNKYGKYPLLFGGETTLLRGTEFPFELVLFDKKTKVAVVRKKSKDTYHKLFIIKCKKGKVLPEMRTGARDIKYIPAEHTLMAREMPEGVKRYLSFAADGKISSTNFAPLHVLSISARQFIKETLIIDENGNVEKYPLMTLEAVKPTPVQKIENGNAAAPKKVNKKQVAAPAPNLAPVVEATPVAPAQKSIQKQTPMPKQTEPAPELAPAPKTEDLVVTTRLIKMTLDGKYYDVFVNGKRILHNHVDTQVKVFLNGTILGVYGRVTDIDNFPDNPSWQIYDASLKRRIFSEINPFTKKSVFIRDVRPMGTESLALEISSKRTVILDEIYSLHRFKIASEKTK